MKILFCPAHYIYDQYYGGSEPYATYEICNRIAEKHCDSVVITGAKKIISPKKYRIIEVQKKKKVLEMNALSAFIFNFKYTHRAIKILKNEKFDLIHHVRPFNLYNTFNLIPLFGINKSTPFIIGSFASPNITRIPLDAKKYRLFKRLFSIITEIFFRKILKYLSIKTLQKSAHIFVYDDELKIEIMKYVSENKITVVPPGKDKEVYYPNKNKEHSILRIICVSNLTKTKGVSVVIKGFAIALKSFQNMHLDIAGDGIEKKRLILLCQELCIENHVTFHGHIENKDMPQFYRKANLLIHMATEEAYGQIYIEAMASGLPIITSLNDGSRRSLRNKEFAIFVKQNDCENLAKNIIKIFSDINNLEKLGNLSRSYFLKSYDWENIIIPKYVSVYKSLTKIK